MFPSLCGTFLWPPEVKAAGKRLRALWEEGVATGEWFKKERTYVYPWLIHVVVWQKPTQHCKVV